MVNYICRTCLYVCENEFSFKRLEKVKPVLELFVPEIKTFVGKYSLICEQCYYFLKNVDKFKIKCIETQKKLYCMNLETIKDNHEALIQSVNKDASLRNQQNIESKSKRTDIENRLVNSKKLKYDPDKVTFTITSQVRNTEPKKPKQKTAAKHCTQGAKIKEEVPKLNNTKSVSEDLLELFNITDDSTDFKSFREFAINGNILTEGINKIQDSSSINTNVEVRKDVEEQHHFSKKDGTDLKSFREFAIKGNTLTQEKYRIQGLFSNITDSGLRKDLDNQHYFSEKDLESAGIVLPNDRNKVLEDKQESEVSESDDDLEIVEISSNDEDSGAENAGRVEIKMSKDCHTNKNLKNEPSHVDDNKEINGKSHDDIDDVFDESLNKTGYQSIALTSIVKTEQDEENPGFFNKKFVDGLYKCRLCDKKYKTSNGLYNHTKDKHSNEVKFYHCQYCSFFTLWRSALVRHLSIFHANIFENPSSKLVKCFHCPFETDSKDILSTHILQNHFYGEFFTCDLCNSRFSDNVSYAKHVEKTHLTT